MDKLGVCFEDVKLVVFLPKYLNAFAEPQCLYPNPIHLWFLFCSDEPLAAGLPLWVVIITVCEAARMLSSSVENLSLPADIILPWLRADLGIKTGLSFMEGERGFVLLGE